MMEVALVFDTEGRTIHWHVPQAPEVDAIPDSRALWDVLWENRHRLGGVAHSHPWKGYPAPSQKDVTTFSAVERGLGKRLLWPVVTMDKVGYWVFNPVHVGYSPCETQEPFVLQGLEELRQRSISAPGQRSSSAPGTAG